MFTLSDLTGLAAPTVQYALLYALPALSVVLSFRVIGFPDLTPDGTFALGGAIAAILLVSGFPA